MVPGSWCPRFLPPMGYNDQDPERNVLLLKDWLDNCRLNHTKCREIKKTMETGTDFLPTRLLDVQAFGTGSKSLSYLGNDVRLVSLSPTTGPESDMNKFPPPYFTLSHCWGPPEKRPTTTTKANLAQRMERIPLFELPRTFQDAIEITRKLGHRYLWIDSLCIVQDDEQDWAHEAGLMAKVYSHSSCTLSALSSKDSSEGLHLEPLDEDRSYMDLMITSHASPAGGSGTKKSDMDDPFFFRFRMFYSLDHWDTLYNGKIQLGLCDDISPLRSRAWTLQERELSRRIIHFAKNQALWECAELKATAQRPWHHSVYPALDPEQEWKEWAGIKKSLESLSLLQDRDGNPVHVAAAAVTASSLLSAYRGEHEWWEMVFDYSQRLLSKDTDKLAALSGMAQFYQRNHFPHARYVAGLWSSRLEEELFWEVDDRTSASRPAEYVAPSWSWAAVNGRVSFRPKDPVWRFQSMRKNILAEAEKDPANPVDAKDKDRDRERDPRKVICEEWKVEEVNLLPRYDDQYGALKGASLIIGGARLVEVKLFTETLIEPDPEYIQGFHRHYGGLKIDGRWVADHRLDVEGEVEQSGCRLWCLGMVAEKHYRERPVIGGLLLREERLDVDGDLCVYSRVGKFHNMAVALFDGVEPRRIKLI
ncbi:heterokaryon incompatibility protein-domain-containing protein [Neurospora tetraspora]|uniref:Heterokaryon incompatibility protein-domain-containing protein n=1 Tax=Neurospora tetraspora TaxID=94610 RepID=A0AAE0JE68_9PEZI|nr:heterokaryon incompatibility protein-domain-containing protein [Neurospora tetraspora]